MLPKASSDFLLPSVSKDLGSFDFADPCRPLTSDLRGLPTAGAMLPPIAEAGSSLPMEEAIPGCAGPVRASNSAAPLTGCASLLILGLPGMALDSFLVIFGRLTRSRSRLLPSAFPGLSIGVLTLDWLLPSGFRAKTGLVLGGGGATSGTGGGMMEEDEAGFRGLRGGTDAAVGAL